MLLHLDFKSRSYYDLDVFLAHHDHRGPGRVVSLDQQLLDQQLAPLDQQ